MKEKEMFSLQFECTMLFQSNPYMIETIDNIATLLGSQKEKIMPVIESLVKQGIIKNRSDNDVPRYSYCEPATNPMCEVEKA
ncbi:hypothetical protein SAMN04487944_12140 [Gracilibacillus ureilyticus]|uniref:Uncharacterized protein n=1 Tax=Gracilibacillus ureilyticus TaxID=531814 RepID=A0A1H9V4B0_9BACI|nr:hypothetical protein [Gracilibacillus ureilyticus]SES16512.1 hypothetical protein SAMN04487944_12140 [Gracilibacillus ureilyticus]